MSGRAGSNGVGAVGDIELNYDLPTGRYSDKTGAPDLYDWGNL